MKDAPAPGGEMGQKSVPAPPGDRGHGQGPARPGWKLTEGFLGDKSGIKGTSSSCPHPQHSLGGAQHVGEPNPDNHKKSHYPGEQLTPVALKTARSLKHFIDANQQDLFLCEWENQAPNSAPTPQQASRSFSISCAGVW